jgi:nucleoside-diphosphate-sugar epimerase
MRNPEHLPRSASQRKDGGLTQFSSPHKAQRMSESTEPTTTGASDFDAVIHNAAVCYREGHRLTDDGVPHVFASNTLSAYILTARIEPPKRLVYPSSGMHHHADANRDDILWKRRRWNGSDAYAESKLHDAMRCWRSRSRIVGLRCSRTRSSLDGFLLRWGAGSPGRYGSGACNAGMACRQRRSEDASYRPIFLSP